MPTWCRPGADLVPTWCRPDAPVCDPLFFLACSAGWWYPSPHGQWTILGQPNQVIAADCQTLQWLFRVCCSPEMMMRRDVPTCPAQAASASASASAFVTAPAAYEYESQYGHGLGHVYSDDCMHEGGGSALRAVSRPDVLCSALVELRSITTAAGGNVGSDEGAPNVETIAVLTAGGAAIVIEMPSFSFSAQSQRLHRRPTLCSYTMGHRGAINGLAWCHHARSAGYGLKGHSLGTSLCLASGTSGGGGHERHRHAGAERSGAHGSNSFGLSMAVMGVAGGDGRQQDESTRPETPGGGNPGGGNPGGGEPWGGSAAPPGSWVGGVEVEAARIRIEIRIQEVVALATIAHHSQRRSIACAVVTHTDTRTRVDTTDAHTRRTKLGTSSQ